ncbi:hypothetical protein GCM10027445_52900 [Amycolatopsis endophytica]|uniref:Wadjet protein JetD C-terminal domain-containing protein n=1 Tax=Amycolatopsis endophytica TaxID=860233 RepID=A0A853BAR6_9PSEU|nr:hypothetical protein [Amycolatopsis endophytica]NYI91771.1 hypothetical protein [Amycolatopsis endophytica]
MTGDLAEVIAVWIAGQSRRHFEVVDLVRCATTNDPSLVGDPLSRDKIARALRALADDERIVLPKSPSAWDDRTHPPLPRWVRKRAAPEKPKPTRALRVWPEVLSAAAAIATRPDELDLLERVASWLRENPDPEPVPLEERALELFGDEKVLNVLLTKRLFTSGALTLELLACYQPPLLFPSQYVHGVGHPRLLVAENNATFQSLLVLARSLEPAGRPAVHLGWGIGNQFPVGVGAVRLLEPPPQALFYFGDLDVAGLRTAAQAAETAIELELPPLRPATTLYRWLLDHGERRPDRSSRGAVDVTALTDWLPEELRGEVERMLRGRTRIAQETLGLKALRAAPDLISDAVRVTPSSKAN